MCLVLISYKQHANYPLIIVANRDEFYQRPSSQAQFWQDHPTVLAGRDKLHGGSWLGVDKSGRIAAVTNYREPSASKSGLKSRGFLVKDYLCGTATPQSYLQEVSGHRKQFDSFNLFIGDKESLYFFSSYLPEPVLLEPGVHGISNGDLDYPWPKVTTGKEALEKIIHAGKKITPEQLFKTLIDKTVPDDIDLPDTGFAVEIERMLAPIFVNSTEYGTRSSTVVIYNSYGEISFSERTFDSHGNATNTVNHEINISS